MRQNNRTLSETPIRRYWPYRWTNRPTGATGIAETTAPLTADEWERLLTRWTVLGAGQWLYQPLPLDLAADQAPPPPTKPLPPYHLDNEEGW